MLHRIGVYRTCQIVSAKNWYSVCQYTIDPVLDRLDRACRLGSHDAVRHVAGMHDPKSDRSTKLGSCNEKGETSWGLGFPQEGFSFAGQHAKVPSVQQLNWLQKVSYCSLSLCKVIDSLSGRGHLGNAGE